MSDRTYARTSGVWHAQRIDQWFSAECGRRIDGPRRQERDRLGDGKLCRGCSRVVMAATDVEDRGPMGDLGAAVSRI